MYNPYLHEPSQALEQNRHKDTGKNLLSGFSERFGGLDSDDILILLIICLLISGGKQEKLWPLVAVLIYCIL